MADRVAVSSRLLLSFVPPLVPALWLIWSALHYKLHHRLDRLPSHVASLGFTDPRAISLLTRCCTIVLMLPAVMLCTWGLLAAELLDILLGFGIFLLGGATLIGFYAISLWHSRKWRLTDPGRSASSVQVALYVALLLFCMFQLAALMNRPFSYVGYSWVFLALNCFPMIRLAFLLGPRSQLIAYLRNTSWLLDTEEGGAAPPAVEASGEAAPAASPSSAAVDGKSKQIIVLYGSALALLIAYALLVLLQAPEPAATSGKYLGIVVAATVVVLDVTVYLMQLGGLLYTPGLVCVVMLVSRGVLIAFGARFWFIGHCSVFFVFALTLAHKLVARLLPPPSLLARRAGKRAKRTGFAAYAPQCTLTMLTLLFTVLTVVAGLLHPAHIIAVPWLSSEQPQYVFGVAALLLVLLYFATLYVYRQLKQMEWVIAGRRRFTLAALLLLYAICGIVMLLVANSILLLCAGLFVPSVVVLSAISYRRWIANDFRIISHMPTAEEVMAAAPATTGKSKAAAGAGGDTTEPTPIAEGEIKHDDDDAGDGEHKESEEKAEEEAKPAARAGGEEKPSCAVAFPITRWFIALSRGLLPSNDVIILGSLLGIFACLLSFTLIVSLTTQPRWFGFGISMLWAILATTVLPITAWFNTFQLNSFIVSTSLISLLLHTGLHLALWQDTLGGAQSNDSLWLLLTYFLYPALVLLGISLYKWRDDKWKAGGFVKKTFALSQLVLLSFIIIVTVVQSLLAGLGLLAAYLLVLYACAVVAKWVSNRFYLPPHWRRSVIIVLFIVAALGISVGSSSQSWEFIGYSVSWGCLFVLLLGTALGQLSVAHRKHLQHSPSMFPAYYFDPTGNTLKQDNSGSALLLTALLMLLVWGFAATVALQPVYIGLFVSAVALVLMVAYVADCMRSSAADFAHSMRVLKSAQDRQLFWKAMRRSYRAAYAAHFTDGEPRLKEAGGDAVLDMLPSLPDMAPVGAGDSTAAMLPSQKLFMRIVNLERLLEASWGFCGTPRVVPGDVEGADFTARLLTLRELDSEMDTLFARELLFSMHMQALLTMEADAQLRHEDADWRRLRGWALAQPAELLEELHLVGLLTAETELEDLLDWDELELARLDALRKRHDAVLAAKEEDDDRKRKEDEDGVRRRNEAAAAAARARERERAFLAELTGEGGKSDEADSDDDDHHRAAARKAAAEAEEAEAEARRIAAEQQAAARRAEEERAAEEAAAAKRKAAAEAARKAAEEQAAARERAEAEAKARAEAEEAARAAGEAAAAEEAARARAEAEEAARKAAEEAAEAERRAAEEEAERKRAEEAAAAARAKREAEAAAAARAAEEAAAAAAAAKASALKAAEEEKKHGGDDDGDDDYEDDDEGHHDPEHDRLLAALAKKARDSGTPYEDSYFFGDAAIGDSAEPPQKWARPAEFCKGKPALAADGYSAADIEQGSLGDCWLLSAFSVVAERPDLMDRVIIARDYSGDVGLFCVQFYKNGKWERIIVDDRFPCREDYGEAHPLYVGSKGGNELWMMVLEKAYAKYHGSYSALQGGWVHLGLADLTGGVGEEIDLSSEAARADISSGAMWDKLRHFAAAGYLMGAGSPAGSDADVSEAGIVQGHAYSLLRVEEESDAAGMHRLVQLRNPWGRTEWNGDWSDSSPLWTRRMRAKLGYTPSEDSEEADDGVFWMSFEDFVQHYATVSLCRLFTTVDDGGEWYKYVGHSQWAGDTAGGYPHPSHKNSVNNPQFFVDVKSPCSAYISLTQHAAKGEATDWHPIALQLLDKGGKRVAAIYQGDVVASSGAYVPAMQVGFEVQLKPGSHPLTLLPSTFDEGMEAEFTVTIYVNQPLGTVGSVRKDPFLLRKLPSSIPAD